MIERKQFIENCNNSRILESFLIDPIDGENAIAYNLSFDYIPKKKKENQRRINYINQFTKRVNLQIYEEARKRFAGSGITSIEFNCDTIFVKST